MAEYSDNVALLEPSATLAITARARQMQAEGRSVVNLSAGEPSFPTPEIAARAASASVAEGRTGYPPTPGLPELRRAVADYANETSGAANASPDQVLVSAGVKQVLFNLVYCLFEEGDEVLVPTPYWPSYLTIVRLSRARPVEVPLHWSDGFRVTADMLERHRTAATKCLLLNSPSNPTGSVVSRDDLATILDWAGEHRIWVLADEIYRRLYYKGGSAASVLDIADRPEHVVSLDGMSKTFSMPGWRIGWGIGPAGLMEVAADLQSQTTSGAAAPSQYASAAMLSAAERESVIEDFRDRLDRRRVESLAGLRSVRAIEVIDQPGAIYHYLKLAEGQDSMAVAEDLLVRGGVATIPGEAFGAPGFIRLSYAASDDVLAEGVRRIADFFG